MYVALLFHLLVIQPLFVEHLLCAAGRLRPREEMGLEQGHSASRGGLGPGLSLPHPQPPVTGLFSLREVASWAEGRGGGGPAELPSSQEPLKS